MQRNSLKAFGSWTMAVLFVAVGAALGAKDKSPNTTVQGTVFLIDKATATIMVDTTGGVRRVVGYTHNTKFKYGRGDKGQESMIDQVQEHQYISCRGTPDDRERLMAQECLHREQR